MFLIKTTDKQNLRNFFVNSLFKKKHTKQCETIILNILYDSISNQFDLLLEILKCQYQRTAPWQKVYSSQIHQVSFHGLRSMRTIYETVRGCPNRSRSWCEWCSLYQGPSIVHTEQLQEYAIPEYLADNLFITVLKT